MSKKHLYCQNRREDEHDRERGNGSQRPGRRYGRLPQYRLESTRSADGGDDAKRGASYGGWRCHGWFALYDVAAGMKFLREQGFRSIVLLGNSGGSGLYSFYTQQSNSSADARIAR